MNTRTQAFAGLGVSCLVLLTACGGGGSTPSVSSTSQSSSPTSATSAPTPTPTLSRTEQNLNSAKEAVNKFVRVTDELGSDPRLNLGKLSSVATGSGKAIAHWRFILTSRRVKQWRQVGKTAIVSSEAKATGGQSFDVVACIDVSKINGVDKAGKSVVSAGRLPRVRYTYKVTKTLSGFYVDDDTVGGSAC